MNEPGEISFAGYIFSNSKGCYACQHVMDGAPVLLFVHESGGTLQFLCGADGHTEEDRRWVHLSLILKWQPDLEIVPKVEFGYEAERVDENSAWRVSKCDGW